jgi:hypothetical protein
MKIVHSKLIGVYSKTAQDNACSDLSFASIEAFRKGDYEQFAHNMDNHLMTYENVFRDKLLSDSLSVFQDNQYGRVPRLQHENEDDEYLYGIYDIDKILDSEKLSEHVLDFITHRTHQIFYRCVSLCMNGVNINVTTHHNSKDNSNNHNNHTDYHDAFDGVIRAVDWFMQSDLLSFNQIFSNFTVWQKEASFFQFIYSHYHEHFVFNEANDNHSQSDYIDNHTSHTHTHTINTFHTERLAFLPIHLTQENWLNSIQQIKILEQDKALEIIEEKKLMLDTVFKRTHLYQKLSHEFYLDESNANANNNNDGYDNTNTNNSSNSNRNGGTQRTIVKI